MAAQQHHPQPSWTSLASAAVRKEAQTPPAVPWARQVRALRAAWPVVVLWPLVLLVLPPDRSKEVLRLHAGTGVEQHQQQHHQDQQEWLQELEAV